MSELKWNEYEVIECLGVLPEIDDHGIYFKVEKHGLILEMSVWHYENLISISLYQTGNEIPFITLLFVVRDEISYVNDKRGSFLRFGNFLIVDSHASYNREDDNFEEAKYPMKLHLELTVEPEISFRIV